MRRCLLAILVAAAAPAALAQQDDRLPDLTPREFTIVGDLQISLPDLQRQPLRGFAPPPRTYVVPADRQPFVAPYAQRLDDLPEIPLAAPAPPSIVRGVPRIGQIDLAAGTQLGRRGRLSLNAGGVGVDLQYDGYSDFRPFEADTSITTQADNLAGRISFAGGDAVRFRIAADGAFHQYGLLGAYGINRDPTTLHPLPERRSIRSLGVEGAIEGAHPAFPFTLRTRFESNGLRELGPTSPFTLGGDPLRSERRYVVGASATPAIASIDGVLALSTLDLAGLNAPSLVEFDAGAAANVPFGEGRLTLGARVFGFDASEENGDAGILRIGPVAELEVPLAGGMRGFARTHAGAASRSLFELFRENPYTHPSLVLAPDLHLIDAEAGVEIQGPRLRLTLFGGGRMSPHLLYFEMEPLYAPADGAPGLYVTRYDEAALLRGGANVTVYGPGNISASAGVEVRATRLTAQERAIPFVSPLVGRLSLAVPFDNTRGLLQASLYTEGERPTGVEDERAPGWADITLEGHYRFAGRFGLLVRADRLGVRAERWPGFPHPPTVLTAGLRAGW